MHQEELGLLKKEIQHIFENLHPDKQDLLDERLQNMPKVSGFVCFNCHLTVNFHIGIWFSQIYWHIEG